MIETAYPLVDLRLSRRLERAEGLVNAAWVEARAELEPALGATWAERAGGVLLFDGVGSYLTQAFALGLGEPLGEQELDGVEAFFRERGAEPLLSISPLAGDTLLPRLVWRGYRPVELTGVLFRPLAPTVVAPVEAGVRVRRVGPDETELWGEVAARGWGSESAEAAAFVRRLGAVHARSRASFAFLAEHDGVPVAAGSLRLAERVAVLSGAATLPEARRRGAQAALLGERLRFAAEQGCDLAMMCTAPGSDSQRNAERWGFRIAYTRIQWHQAAAAAADGSAG